MKIIHIMLAALIGLLVIIMLAAIMPEVQGATGGLHPTHKGMFISPANVDQQTHTRWLGYLWGAGIIALFGALLFMGNRKKGKITIIGKWIAIGIGTYFIAYSMMVFSNWSYGTDMSTDFFGFLPKPTAWMIYVMWFVPVIITASYVLLFEKAIISPEEEAEFHEFLKNNN